MVHFKMKIHCVSLLAALIVMVPVASHAQDGTVDILPPVLEAESTEIVASSDTTHPTVHLTPDKSELVRLDEDASSIIIGNPLHINVVADSSKTLVIVPRVPGATHFTVLGKNGQVLMQRHVIVASPKEDYIRVKRTCTEEAGDGCQQTSVFYCPDMCHEIGIMVDPGETSQQADTSSGQSGNSAEDGNSAPPAPQDN